MALRQYFLLLICSAWYLFSSSACAQSTQVSATFPIKLVCTYRLTFVPDSMSRDTQTELMDLFITDSLTSFRSRNRFKRDSIISSNKGVPTSLEASELVSKAIQFPKPKFTYIIYKKARTKSCVVYDNIFRDNFFYKEEMFPCSWTLNSEKAQVGGYNCQKATTSFAGRKYTAWFTREIPISDGPYKFSNLPGLIVKISDSQNNYSFELIQFTKPKTLHYLSLPQQKATATTKREFFLADKAARQDAINRLAQMGFAVNNQQQVNADYQSRLKHKNNPIEIKY